MESHNSPYLNIIKESEENKAILYANGEIDLSSSSLLTNFIVSSLTRFDIDHIVVDLQDITFMDCRALSSFIISNIVADAQGKSFSLQNPSRQAEKLLDIAGLKEHFAIDYMYNEEPSSVDNYWDLQIMEESSSDRQLKQDSE
jgi:anti-anti-sigma factor